MEERSIELDHATLNQNYTQATGHTAGGVYRFNPATNDLTDF